MPQWPATRWLADAGKDVPHEIRVALIAGLFGTLPIFFGGVVNSIMVALVIALRRPEPLFQLWLGLEIAICLGRLLVLAAARRNARHGGRTHTDLYLLLAVMWAASVGYGGFISIISGDWVIATLSCLSAAAMVGGICFRNFGAPRMTAVMITLTLGPCCLAALIADEPVLWLIFIQAPFYLFSMTMASYRLNRMLVTTMRAERENERRALQDSLTGLANRSALLAAIDAAIGEGRAGRAAYAVYYLDLDGFKAVNDTHGHAAGDALLRAVGERLEGLKPHGAMAARIGGDEFVLLVPLAPGFDVTAFGHQVIATVCSPYVLPSAVQARIGTSLGIARIPGHGNDTAAVLHAADRALYAAKTAGGSRCAQAA
ncbi:GGDEF domain-containing protein [Orrella sp. JC864]